MSAQLIAKVSNLDGTVQEQMTLNQTLQQEVARANEMNDQMSEQEGKVRRLEAENTQYQEKIKKLQQVHARFRYYTFVFDRIIDGCKRDVLRIIS